MVKQILFPLEQIEHIARHGVTPEEFRQVCLNPQTMRLRMNSRGANPGYIYLGTTAAGKYLMCAMIEFPDGNGFPITARPMTTAERQRYRRWSFR